MNSIELIGFKSTVLDLLTNDKRQLAFDLLDHFFEKAKTLTEFDAIGELSLKTEYRALRLKCAETAHAIAVTTDEKRSSRTNLINAYNAMNYPEKALYYIELQLKQTPDDFLTLCQKTANISLMGDKETAEKIIKDLFVKFPEKQLDLNNMMYSKFLKEGNLAKGIVSFVESYKKKNDLFETQLNMKRWDGIARPGRTVYVNSEGGIGDELINIRFFKHIEKLGMIPILCSPNNNFYKDKNNLFRRHGIEILSESYSIDKTQYWAPMMSLPSILNLSEKDLWSGTYLEPLGKKAINNNGKFKIGIKCAGNPFFAQDEYRKIPLDLMLSYLPEDADIYYIDKLKVDHPRVTNLADEIDSWEDTLDIINSMDCIVSSCTSLVHAAGAIGKTTFVVVPIAEYYIWTTSRTDYSSPWYGPNFHVMKQKELRDWNKPLSEVQKEINYIMEQNLE
jgi:hypothetical protein